MSDSADKEKEYSDIELCYKAMGLSFSDNPERVEGTYRKLKDEYTKAAHSTDLAARAGAAENLKQLEELFATITASLIYKDYAREYEKYKALKAEQIAERKQKQLDKQVPKESLTSCPYCHKPIAPNLKVCIYCHGKILSPAEQLMKNLLSTKNIIIFVIVVFVLLAAIAGIINK